MEMKYYIRYWLFRLVMFSTSVLPARFAYWVSIRIADLGYFLGDRKGRNAVMRNLRQVMPDESQGRIIYETRWVFRNWGKYFTEFFRFSSFDRMYFLKHVSVSNLHHITNALKAGKGCMIMSAHVSNWELGAAYYAVRMGLKVNVVAARHHSERINKLFVEQRTAMGINVIYTEEAGVKVLRALKNNEIVCILSDRDVGGFGIEVDFFGRKCRFPQGPVRFAIKSGAMCIPGFVTRRTNDSFVIDMKEPIVFPQELDKVAKVEYGIREYIKYLEEFIRLHPEEWPVFYDIWDEEWHD